MLLYLHDIAKLFFLLDIIEFLFFLLNADIILANATD